MRFFGLPAAAFGGTALAACGLSHAATFNFNLDPLDPNADTLVQQIDAAWGTITDSVTGQSLEVRAGYHDAGDVKTFTDPSGYQSIGIVLAGTPGNGSGVDVGDAAGSQPNEIQSNQQPGIFKEFIEFRVGSVLEQVELTNIRLPGLATVGGEQERVLLEYGATTTTITGDDLVSDFYEFPANTILQPGDILRVTALSTEPSGNRTSFRLQFLNAEVSLIPEPASLAMGSAGLGLLLRRRRG